MKKTYYTFTAHSSFNFLITARGIEKRVKFSPVYKGISMYQTTDNVIAEAIKHHRWFRQKLISLRVEEVEVTEKKEIPVQGSSFMGYKIAGVRMASPAAPIPTVSVQEQIPDPVADIAQPEPVPDPEMQSYNPEEVTTFMEAKRFFQEVYGCSQTECQNKEAISALCVKYNVSFPNYPL